ncbi:DUF6488 family protein [Halobacteriovorax sp.]|uniref:DUF6488 family protein n=1 Tax=Halobacteriovorax sp. TaxID=2020862 RepID=UPI003567A53E
MKLITFIIAIAISTYTFGGEGHGHSHSNGHSHSHEKKEITKDKALVIAKQNIERLIKAKKIHTSWKGSKLDSSVKKKFNNKTEWLLTFSNEEGEKGKKLFIFLNLSGEFVAANFTGK